MVKEEKIKPDYKPSPLGPIPIDWEVMELKTLVEKVGSGITPTGGEKVYKNEGRFFLRSQNVGWGTLLLDDVAFIDEQTHQSFKSTELEFEDVLLNITGASIGRSSIADMRIVGGNVNQHVCIIRPNRKYLSPYFLNAFILSQRGQNLIDSYQAGGNRQGLNFEQIKSFRIPVPPLKEQTAIANLLSTWDKAINNLNKLIAQKELRKKWLMQQLLTGKKRLKGFKGEWREYHLGDFFDERNETKCKNLPLLSIGQEGVYPQSDSVKKDTSNEDKSKYKRICPGDIGYNTMRMWQGRSALSSLEGIVSPAYTIVTPKENADSLYFAYLFQTPKVVNSFFRNSQGLVEDTLNCKFPDFAIVKIYAPTKEEQTAIANVLQSADAELNLLRQKLDKLKEQKKGLMQVLLTGKKRLKF